MPKPKRKCSQCGTNLEYNRKFGWFCRPCMLAAYLSDISQKAAVKKYRQTAKGKKAERRYETSPKGKAARERYLKSAKYKERRKEYNKRLQESLRIAREAGLRTRGALEPELFYEKEERA